MSATYELCYLGALSEKCTMVAATLFAMWLQDGMPASDCLGDLVKAFFSVVDIFSIRQIPTAMCRETSSHMWAGISREISDRGDFSSVKNALETLRETLVYKANKDGYTTKKLIRDCSNLPFIGTFAAQSFITLACLTGVIERVDHATCGVVSDISKPHCQALFAMGLKTLDSVNRLVELIARRLNIPRKTVENLLCKIYRSSLIREFVVTGQKFYLLVHREQEQGWKVATKGWGEDMWVRH